MPGALHRISTGAQGTVSGLECPGCATARVQARKPRGRPGGGLPCLVRGRKTWVPLGREVGSVGTAHREGLVQGCALWPPPGRQDWTSRPLRPPTEGIWGGTGLRDPSRPPVSQNRVTLPLLPISVGSTQAVTEPRAGGGSRAHSLPWGGRYPENLSPARATPLPAHREEPRGPPLTTRRLSWLSTPPPAAPQENRAARWRQEEGVGLLRDAEVNRLLESGCGSFPALVAGKGVWSPGVGLQVQVAAGGPGLTWGPWTKPPVPL